MDAKTKERIQERGLGAVAFEALTQRDDSHANANVNDSDATLLRNVESKTGAQYASNSKAKTQEQNASEQMKATASRVQHTIQDQFAALKSKVSQSFQSDPNNPGLIDHISGTFRVATHSAADGVRRTAENISRNAKVQQTVPTVVEAATSSLYFVSAFVAQYLSSFRPFFMAMLQQPLYVQIIAGLSFVTHGILPLMYLDKWLAHTVLQCYVLSIFLSHLVFTTTGHLRFLFAGHIVMLPIMWSLFWETETQSASLANLRDQIHEGSATSLFTHPMAIRHYTYVLWTKAVGFVTTSIFTLDFAEIDLVWKHISRQRASIVQSISKQLHPRNDSEVDSFQRDFDAENTFDEISDTPSWKQKPFNFDEFMDLSHLTKHAVVSEEKPDKSYDSFGETTTRFKDTQRLENTSDTQKFYEPEAMNPTSQNTSNQTTTQVL